MKKIIYTLILLIPIISYSEENLELFEDEQRPVYVNVDIERFRQSIINAKRKEFSKYLETKERYYLAKCEAYEDVLDNMYLYYK